MEWFAAHRKAIVALAGALATFAVSVGLTDRYQWLGAVVGVLAAVGVYQTPNRQTPHPHAIPTRKVG